MPDIELNVPFKEKDMVKALGAKWNPLKRVWFIPTGLALKPFARWLDDETLTEIDFSDLEDNSNGQTLTMYLAHITQAIASIGRTPQWVKAEISHLPPPKRGHHYLELVEQNDLGQLTAKASAIIWHSQATKLMPKFESVTGSPLQADMKVLLSVTAKFDPLYGFKLHIEDIDPAYTLGDMAEKLAKIREQLKAEQLFDANKQLTLPTDFTRVAVISPSHAAGLGDFQREAAILQKHQLCTFEYFQAQFQGKEAPESLLEKIQTILAEHAKHPYDGLIIIRGGGAVTDLAWLNDFTLAKALCQLPLPILTGIGHQKDKTIIDEIACQSFDTPSKVSAFLFSTISHHAKTAYENWRQINQLVQQSIITAESGVNTYLTLLHEVTKSQWQQATQSIQWVLLETSHQTQQQWQQTKQSITSLKDSTFQMMLDGIKQSDVKLSFFDLTKLQAEFKQALQSASINLQNVWDMIHLQTSTAIQNNQLAVEHFIKEIVGLGPQATLKRGFVMVTDEQARPIATCRDAKSHSQLNLTFKDGTIPAKTNLEN